MRSKLLSASLVLAGLGILSFPAYATITVAPANGGGLYGSVIYYGVKTSDHDPGTVHDTQDTSAGFKKLDVTKVQPVGSAFDDDSSYSNIFLFDVTSSATATSATGSLVLTVKVTGSGGDSGGRVIPIARIGDVYCAGTDNSYCRSGSGSYSYAARFTPGNTLRIGVYPKDICGSYASAGGEANGCTASDVVPPTSLSTGITLMPLTFEITAEDTAKTAFDTAAIYKLSMQTEAPTFNCSLLEHIYFPGDGEILLNATGFSIGSTGSSSLGTGRAPLTTVVVVADEGADPDVSIGGFTSNPLVLRIPSGVANSSVAGFTNTTDGSDHKYNLSFLLRDAAGMLAKPNSVTDCHLEDVQTSRIQGFLSNSKCFIATAAFRESEAGPVLLLRAFRDQILERSRWGHAFVQWYYSWSPAQAEWLIENPAFRIPVLVLLIPVEFVAWLFLQEALFYFALFQGVLVLCGSLVRFRKVSFHAAGVLVSLLVFGSTAWAQEKSSQPYIDRLKEGMEQSPPPSSATGGAFTEREKAKLGADPKAQGGYIEKLKKGLEEQKTPDESGSYLEREKARLTKEGEGEGEKSAIAKVKAGSSQLEAKKVGSIHNAFGFRIGASTTRDLTAAAGAYSRPFAGIYGAAWAPDATLFYEFQPFHSEWFGSIGILVSGGVGVYRGKGRFEFPLFNKAANEPFPEESQTSLVFLAAPVTVGLNYRFNLFRMVRPFVGAGPNVIGYMEARSDSQKGKRSYSAGMWMTGGVAILLNWISKDADWDLYAEHGIKKFYLTIEYNKQSRLAGDIDYALSGIYAGLTFEY